MRAPGDEADDGPGGRRFLRVEYPDVQSFLSDYHENIKNGSTFISSSRSWAVGGQLKLTLTFPGLLEPIQLQGRVSWARVGAEPGVGVEFTPSEDPQLQRTIEAIEAGDPNVVARLVRVLVVEDNAFFCEMLKDGLSRQTPRGRPVPAVFLVHSALNGAEALAIIEEKPIDMLIADIFLPVMGGGSLIKTCRELFGVQLPIIAISGGGPEARKLAAESGADLFLAKPLRLITMYEAMIHMLGIDLNE